MGSQRGHSGTHTLPWAQAPGPPCLSIYLLAVLGCQ